MSAFFDNIITFFQNFGSQFQTFVKVFPPEISVLLLVVFSVSIIYLFVGR